MPKNSTPHAGTNSLPASQHECEWDSETEGAENEKGFRINVDLSEYWGSAAACVAWVRRASQRGRRLRWLARRLRAAAALRRPFCLLLSAGAALAPRDPLRLLRPTDSLRVVPVEHEWQKSFSFCEDEDETESPGPERNGGISSSPKTKQMESESPAPLETMTRRSIESSLSPVSIETCATGNSTLADVVEMERAPVSAFSPVSGDGDEALQGVKRRALALLDTWRAAGGAGGAGASEAGGAPPRRKRRRVRRRKKPDGAPTTEPAPSPDPTPTLPLRAFLEPPQASGSPNGEGRSPPPPPPPPAPALLRNAAPPRPPRLVRPLPPPSTPNTEPAPRAVC